MVIKPMKPNDRQMDESACRLHTGQTLSNREDPTKIIGLVPPVSEVNENNAMHTT